MLQLFNDNRYKYYLLSDLERIECCSIVRCGVFELRKLCDANAPQWDAVVRTSKNGNFLHLYGYLNYHAHRFVDASVIVYQRNTPVAIFPCNRVCDTVISHAGLTYGGLIYGSSLRVLEILEIFNRLSEHYRTIGIQKICYRAVPHIFHKYPAEEDLYCLYRLGARLVRRALSTAILLPERPQFSVLRRRHIRKAKANSISTRECSSIEDFFVLLSLSLARHGIKPAHTVDELKLLHQRFPDEIRVFGAFKEGAAGMLAGAVIFDFGTVAHTQYLASSDEGRALGALDLILGSAIELFFAGRQYFSFGVSTDIHDCLNEGLVFQKEGFGGRAVLHDVYELTLS
jgi:hypothetical protein